MRQLYKRNATLKKKSTCVLVVVVGCGYKLFMYTCFENVFYYLKTFYLYCS